MHINYYKELVRLPVLSHVQLCLNCQSIYPTISLSRQLKKKFKQKWCSEKGASQKYWLHDTLNYISVHL